MKEEADELELQNSETIQGMSLDRTFVIKGHKLVIYKTNPENQNQLKVNFILLI
jgi:hypothetical protein